MMTATENCEAALHLTNEQFSHNTICRYHGSFPRSAEEAVINVNSETVDTVTLLHEDKVNKQRILINTQAILAIRMMIYSPVR